MKIKTPEWTIEKIIAIDDYKLKIDFVHGIHCVHGTANKERDESNGNVADGNSLNRAYIRHAEIPC